MVISGRKPKNWEENLKCHFVHHESHLKSSGIAPRSPRTEAKSSHLSYDMAARLYGGDEKYIKNFGQKASKGERET
jgi:hypothetical protein